MRLYTIKPISGLGIVIISVLLFSFILGGKNPKFSDFNSKIANGFGVSVSIPT